MSTVNGQRDGEYTTKLIDLLVEQKINVDPAAVGAVTTRKDLGIGSLDAIMLIVKYIGEREVSLRPEWVSDLDTVAGICEVLQKIDAAAPAR